MARVLNVICALLLCVALTQPSHAFPLYGGCDSYNDCYDDCAECGYLRYPDEPLLPLQVIQGGPTCYRGKPLPYQVQVPLPPPTASCGQQFGVRVEVPYQSVGCKPCLNIGYEVETPVTPCSPRLPNLPVSLTVPAPQFSCHQPCHINYEVETPVAPCAPFLTNLKTQVDRVVLPCPCPAPIVEGYVRRSDLSERCKRSVECQDSGCDCDCDDDDDEDDEDDCVDDRTYSRSRRSPANWRPCSYNSRTDLFPESRTDQSPRSDWTDGRIGLGQIEEYDYENDLSDEPVTQILRFSTQDANNGNRRNGSVGNSQSGSEQRIVSRDSGNSDDQERVVNRSLGNQGDEERIVDRSLGSQDDQKRIVNQRSGVQGDQDRIVSRDLPRDYDYPQWNTGLSSDPVEKRLQDPNFGNRQTHSLDEMDRLLIESLLSGNGQSGNRNQQGPSDTNGGETNIDNLLGTLRTDPQQGGRTQLTREGGSQQYIRPNMQAPPNRIRLNGSSGQNRNPAREMGSQDRITTPNTFRMGRPKQGDPQEQDGVPSQETSQMLGGSQGLDGSQREGASQRQAGVQQRQGGSQQNLGGSHQIPDDPQQRTGGSQQKTGSTQQRTGGPQQRTGSSQQRTGGLQQRTGGPQHTTGGSQQKPGGPQQRTGGTQQRTGGTQQRTGGSQQMPGDSQQRTSGSQQKTGGSEQRTGGSQQIPGGSQQRTGASQQRSGGSQQRSGGSQQGPGGPQMNGRSPILNGPQGQPSSEDLQQRTGPPNQQQRSPGQSPGQSPNSNQGKHPDQCSICERRRSLANNPFNLMLSLPDERIRFSDYLDFPKDLRPPVMNIPPPRTHLPQQRTPQQPSQSKNHQIPQIPPTTSGAIPNAPGIPQLPQPPSLADTSRIVTPSTYDEQPDYFDYSY